MEAERAGLLEELDQVKTSLTQAKTTKQFGTAEVRGLLDALWRDLEERREVAKTGIALQEMIPKVELEPGSTRVKTHYAFTTRSRLYRRVLLIQPG